jgi:hypothetical protein
MRSVDYRSSLETGEIQEGFVFILRKQNMAGQTKHFEQRDCLIVYFGKNDAGAALFRNVDDPEEDRDTDTVNEFGLAKVNDECPATAIQTSPALTLNFFTGQLIKVVASVNNSGGANTVRAY